MPQQRHPEEEEEEEHQWEQETALELRRSTFRNGHSPPLEFLLPSPVTTDDDDDDIIPPLFDTNSNICDPNGGVVDPMVALFDHQNRLAASTDPHPHHSLTPTTHSNSPTSVYYDSSQGTALNSTCSGEEHAREKHGDEISVFDTGDVSVQKNFDSIFDHRVDKDQICSTLLSPQHSKMLSQEYVTTPKSLGKYEIEAEDVGLINEFGLEVTKIDLKRVLDKQNTHDLYCPNCNSCITRRVILRKRKRDVGITSEQAKRNQLEIAVESSFTHGDGLLTNNQIHNSAGIHTDGTSELAGKDSGRDGKPDIFRCLSCFTFFIPTGNGFKIFRRFENKGQSNAVQDQRKTRSKSWISSIFASHKEPASESDGQSFSKHQNLSPTMEFKGSAESGISESQEDGRYLTKERLTNEVTPNTGDHSKEAIQGDTAKDNFEAVTSSQIDTVTASAHEKSSTGQNPDLTIQNTDAGKDTVIVIEPEKVCNADSQISQHLNGLEETEASSSLNALASATELE